MEYPVTLLCKNPSKDKEKRIEQAIMCAIIDGYTDATADLSRFIYKLYQDKNENAHLVHRILAPLIKKQDEYYDKLCDELNEILGRNKIINKLQLKIWEALCELSGEEVVRVFTDFYGDQLLDDEFLEYLQDEGIMEE